MFEGKVTHHKVTRTVEGAAFSLNGAPTGQKTLLDLAKHLKVTAVVSCDDYAWTPSQHLSPTPPFTHDK
jgi:hypothetical protein